ncbi:MAG: phosphotransferase [Gammaproteobacteria bacterium]|nr:phosphotransferase [Gammaproteobacteria bacterium]
MMTAAINPRQQALYTWLDKICAVQPQHMRFLAGDASFRRYFRVQEGNTSKVVMDAPPQQEPCEGFIAIAQAFKQLGLHVPEIFAVDLSQGFVLLGDFGDKLYSTVLTDENAQSLYQCALQALTIIQTCPPIAHHPFTDFVGICQRDLQICQQWFFSDLLALSLSPVEQQLLHDTFQQLTDRLIQQPQVCIHRDYHSRNLLVLPDRQVGIIDFQDAMWGPITYDAVSLLRDCYIDWPKDKVKQWAEYFYQQLNLSNCTWLQFLFWFDMAGLQRHLKALGTFARKCQRDGHRDYLAYVPRTLNYIMEVSADYQEFKFFREWMKRVVLPAWEKQL